MHTLGDLRLDERYKNPSPDIPLTNTLLPPHFEDLLRVVRSNYRNIEQRIKITFRTNTYHSKASSEHQA